MCMTTSDSKWRRWRRYSFCTFYKSKLMLHVHENGMYECAAVYSTFRKYTTKIWYTPPLNKHDPEGSWKWAKDDAVGRSPSYSAPLPQYYACMPIFVPILSKQACIWLISSVLHAFKDACKPKQIWHTDMLTLSPSPLGEAGCGESARTSHPE